MKLAFDQLHRHLHVGNLKSVYLISGDEAFQMKEAVDDIRIHARQQDYSEREILDVGTHFDWNRLRAESNAMSLFSTRRLLELRLSSAKPGREGSKALCDYLAAPPADTLLMISMPKLSPEQKRSKWFIHVEKVGVVIQVWPIQANAMAGWIKHRAEHQGLTLDYQSLQVIAQHTEGNLLAAAQELEKLRLNYGLGEITLEQVTESVSGSSHYTVFELTDSMLSGACARALKIIRTLSAQGVAGSLVLWAIGRELRLVIGILECMQKQQSLTYFFNQQRIWKTRQQPLIKAAKHYAPAMLYHQLRVLSGVDAALKSSAQQQAWLMMEQVILSMKR